MFTTSRGQPIVNHYISLQDNSKKDISWIRETRKKLEELVKQIKQQLSDPEEIPVIYEDETEEENSDKDRGDRGFLHAVIVVR